MDKPKSNSLTIQINQKSKRSENKSNQNKSGIPALLKNEL
jgi:hypothetical protein